MNLFALFNKAIPSWHAGYIKTETEDKINKDYKKIDVMLQTRSPSSLKQALITADKCLDNALKDTVKGLSMGERLKNAINKFNFDFYNKIWEAHKVRNNMVHETDYDPPYFLVKDSIEILKKATQELGVRFK